jgi:hypothetical protein
MSIMRWLKTGTVIGAIVLAPGVGMAAQVKACVASPPTPESYTWNFSREGTRLLNEMRYDAHRVAYHADNLKNYELNPEIDWQLHADQLVKIKREVNDMGKRLCRLEVIRGAIAPWEQNAVRQVAPLVQYMADNSTDAINYLNAHQGEFWVPSYRLEVRNLNTEAHTLARKVHNDENLAGLSQKEMNAGMYPVIG